MSGEGQGARRVREAVAVFDDVAAYEAALHGLLEAGFTPEEIQMLAGFETVERRLGHRYRRVEELEDEPRAPRTAFVHVEELEEAEVAVANSLTVLPSLLAGGLVVASSGPLAALLAGAAMAGGMLATLFSEWMGETRARRLVEQLEHGGILLWVRTDTPEKKTKALEILRRAGGRDVHIHEIPLPATD